MLRFYIWMMLGLIKPTHERYEGLKTYYLRTSDSTIVHNAYKNECINFIKTKKFDYGDYCN